MPKIVCYSRRLAIGLHLIEDNGYLASGNLSYRQNNIASNLREDFTFDNLDRLDDVKMGSTVTLDMAYDGNKGAITIYN